MNDPDVFDKRIYRQPLNYENGVLLAKIRDICLWRDTNSKAYESGVMTLALLLPPELRKEALQYWYKTGTYQKGKREDLTEDGKIDFDDLFVFVLNILEKNNLCFPKIRFEVGHD